MKDTCKQAISRKDIRESQESCRSLESGDQGKRGLEFFQQECPTNNTVMVKLRSGLGHRSGSDEDSRWSRHSLGPTVGPTGDPDGLDPSEVPDDLPTSLPHDSSL